MKYGIKVPFPDGGHLWVTSGDMKFQLVPVLFETKQEAEAYALNVWGNYATVEEYGEDQNSN
jgi:hypothetical protein